MNFADRLKQLPTVAHLAALELRDGQGQVLATIENKPGQGGSLAVYHALGALYGGHITPAAATLGLEWYAEHTADAQAHPGKHPNIDRLLTWAHGQATFAVRAIPAPMTTGTVTLHRVLRAPPERIYRALLDADALCKWLPPHGFTGRVLHLDARTGGSYRMQFTNLGNGQSHAFGGDYLELVPNERIVKTDRFDDPNLPGAMRTTLTLKAVLVGTELTAVQEGIPAMIPTEACYLGWQESLQLLALLVEPDIPAG